MRAIVHSMPPQSSSEAGSSSICPLFATSKSCAVAAGSYTALLTRLRLSIYQGESAFEQRWGRSRPQVRIYMIDRPRLISAKVHCLRDLCIPAIDVGKETDAAIFIQISDVINQYYRDFAGKSDETFLSAVGESFFKLQNNAIQFSQYPSKTGGILHAKVNVAPVQRRVFTKVTGRRVGQGTRRT